MTADTLSLLVRDAFGDDARVLDRHPAAYRSSLPIEEVTVVTGDGRRRRLAAKDGLPCEIDAYRRVLARLGLATAAFVGARDGLLLLEWVEGTPLWQSGDAADWDAAARWLAALHAAPLPPDPDWLPRLDAQRLCGWADRPLAPELRRLVPLARAAAARLDRLPIVLVHGEFYPANVLVDAGRIRPVDWETLALGPGVLDLAALIAGSWPGDEPARMRAAYLAALPARLVPPAAALADARLIVALGWAASPDLRPPPEQANDWVGEALRCAAEVAA